MIEPEQDTAAETAKTRADRQHQREYIVLRAIVAFANEPPISCGLMDISVSGAKLKHEGIPPEVGSHVIISVEAIRTRVAGEVVRVFQTPTGVEIAVRFDRVYTDIPGRLLEYKLRSFSKGSGMRRR